MATLESLQSALARVAFDNRIPTQGQRTEIQRQLREKIARDYPSAAKAMTGAPEGMAPTGATVNGIRYEPQADAELSDRERALKQAQLITSRYSVPFLQTPARSAVAPVDGKGGRPAIPAIIGRRPGTVADFMSGSNPNQTYTSPGAVVAIDDLTGIPEVSNERTPRPAMYFGPDVPAIPVDPQDYMNVMDLQSRAASIPNISGSNVTTARMPVTNITPAPTPTPRVVTADPFAGVPLLDQADPSIIGDPRFSGNDKRKKIDKDSAIQFMDQAGNDIVKAQKLAGDAGFYW